MEEAKVGDRLILESERIGTPPRKGVILEILGAESGLHYRVRWDDEHESLFYPTGGSVRIVSPVPAGA